MSAAPDPTLRHWQRTATEDLWDRTLSQIPTRIGRMAYLARLKSPQTARYEHYGLSAIFGEAAAEDAIERSHLDVLESWLGLSLLDQRDDVNNYITSLPQSPRRLLLNWEKSRTYTGFLPDQASPAQKELFSANIQLIVKHLRRVHASSEPPRPSP